ncbi:MAG: class I SAM-dependent methyltransferase [Proteobacteria bacterium]|nr:class I SAM-dependent methyltransferase [Pseudomonadota bacterium]
MDATPAAPQVATTGAHCRFCAAPLTQTFVDLGVSPLCQTHISEAQLNSMEPFYPLHALVCGRCWLVQLQQYVAPADIFSEYAYFSSYSDSWVEHARRYAVAMCERLALGAGSLVMEIASNDGYLLQHFVARGVPVLGIEPAANIAAVARQRGVRTEARFFGRDTAAALAQQYGKPDLLLGNNVLAHVPDLNDFVAGMKVLLKPGGVLTMEFPHLERLVDENQFDTIYHEHFSYFSFVTVERVFAAHGLTLFDVEELSTHGGSLRIYGRHTEDSSHPVTARAQALRRREQQRGLESPGFYRGFGARVQATKRALLQFLIEARTAGRSVVGYGAPGKGNTLLNYCGIRTDFLDYTVDRNPYKQGKYTPGTRIPILAPERIGATRPDYILILPWNLAQEITAQLAYVRAWGCRFVVPIPALRIMD